MNDVQILTVMAALCLAVCAMGLPLMFWLSKRVLANLRSRLEYDDLEYHPLDVTELPRGTREHFDRLTPDMVDLGFRAIGDFRIRSAPLTLVRRFISPDGRTFGEIVDAKIMLLSHLRTFDFISVLADGTYFETGALGVPHVPAEIAWRLQLLGVPGASVEELYRRHVDHLEHYTGGGCNPPLEFEPEESHEVGNYGHHLVVWGRRLRVGLEGDPPVLSRAQEAELAGAVG